MNLLHRVNTIKKDTVFLNAVSFVMEVKMKTYMPILLGFAYYTVYNILKVNYCHLCAKSVIAIQLLHYIFSNIGLKYFSSASLRAFVASSNVLNLPKNTKRF